MRYRYDIALRSERADLRTTERPPLSGAVVEAARRTYGVTGKTIFLVVCGGCVVVDRRHDTRYLWYLVHDLVWLRSEFETTEPP